MLTGVQVKLLVLPVSLVLCAICGNSVAEAKLSPLLISKLTHFYVDPQLELTIRILSLHPMSMCSYCYIENIQYEDKQCT